MCRLEPIPPRATREFGITPHDKHVWPGDDVDWRRRRPAPVPAAAADRAGAVPRANRADAEPAALLALILAQRPIPC
jgi:hypothetical protein